MYSLVEWIDEKKYSVIPLSRVKEPRKSYEDYKEGDIVKASCPGFSGIHNAKLVAIRGNTTDDKKQLERLAIEHVEKMESSEEGPMQEISGTDDQRQGVQECHREREKEKPEKRKRKVTDKSTGKKTKTQENKENREAEKEIRQQKKEEQQKKKQTLLKKNELFLSSLNSFKDTVNTESQDIQPNPTTATPPDSEGSTYIDLDNQSCPQQVSANEPPSVATSLPSNNTVNNAVNNAMYHNQVMSNTFMNQNQMCYGYQSSQMNNYSNSPMMPFQPQTYNWQQNQFYNTPEVNRWPQDQDRYGSNYRFAHETTCSTPVSNNSNYDKENPACRQIFPVEEMQQTKKNCKECDKIKEELQKANKRIRELEKELLAASTNKTSTGDSSTYKVQTDGRPRAGVLSSGVAAANHMIELMPNTNVYIYPKDLKVVNKKSSGCAKARYLLSAFYTNDELVEAGNLSGARNKKGLDKQIVQTIIEYAVLKSDDKLTDINIALRSKVSALVCVSRKAEAGRDVEVTRL